MSSTLEIVPVTRDFARAFVQRVHRHLPAPPGDVFRLGVRRDGEVVGVAMSGRPVAIALCDGWTLEVNRVAVDGTKHANSMLYAASWRAAKALGWRRMVSYTLPEESGASLRAAGFIQVGVTAGGEWSRPSRVRKPVALSMPKIRWEIKLASYPQQE